MLGDNPQELAAEFQQAEALNPQLERTVYHASLSVPQHEAMDEQTWRAIADEYRRGMGFEGSQFAVYHHSDTEHDHIHIVACRTRPEDGSTVSDSWDYRRSEVLIRKLERDYELEAVTPSWEKERRAPTTGEFRQCERTGEASVRQQLQAAIAQAAQEQADWERFAQQLERDRDIEVRAGERGVSYGQGEWAFSGTRLGQSYTQPALESRLEQERQQQDDAWIVANAVADLMPRRKSLEEIKAESEEQIAQQRAQRQSPAERESKNDLQIKLLHWYNHALELGRSQTYLNKISEVERDVGLRGPEAMTEPARAAMQRDAQQWEAQQQVQAAAGGEESSQQRQAQSQQHRVERTPAGGEQQCQLSKQQQREVVSLAQYLVVEHGPQQGQNYKLVGDPDNFELHSKHDDRGTLLRYRQGQAEAGQLRQQDLEVLRGAVQAYEGQSQQAPQQERDRDELELG